MFFASLVLAVAGGMGLAAQGPTNGTLSRHIGNLAATTLNFTVGTLILVLMTVFAGSGDLCGAADAQWWQFLGGPYGVCLVLCVTYTVAILGMALTSSSILFGQIFMGLVIDSFGLFQTEKTDISLLRILGCAIVLAGVILVYLGNRKTDTIRDKKAMAVSVIVCFFAGCAGAAQAPTNASLALHVGNIEASLFSFLGGLFFIALITLGVRIRRGHFTFYRLSDIKPWMFTGGFYGSFAVFVNTIATPYLGVALLVTAMMLGQLSGGMIIDTLGLLRAKKQSANAFRVCGVLVILIGVIVITVAKGQA